MKFKINYCLFPALDVIHLVSLGVVHHQWMHKPTHWVYASLMVDSHLANRDITFIIILSRIFSSSAFRVRTNTADYIHICAHRPHESLIIAKNM